MDAYHRGGRLADGGAKHLPRMDQAAGRGAGGDLDALDEPVLAVEAERPEFLHRQARHERLEMREDQFRTVQQRRLARALPQDTASNLHHRDKLERLDAPDTFQPAVVGFGPCNEAGQRAGFGNEAGSQREHIHATAAAAQEHGQKLGVAQRGGPEVLEPLLRAFAHGEVAEAGRRARAGVIHAENDPKERIKGKKILLWAKTLDPGGTRKAERPASTASSSQSVMWTSRSTEPHLFGSARLRRSSRTRCGGGARASAPATGGSSAGPKCAQFHPAPRRATGCRRTFDPRRRARSFPRA